MSFAPPTRPGTRYRVYMTPRTAPYTYGTEVEVTDHITINGINKIKRGIDSSDYEVGVYFYSDLELIGSNDNGYFNDNDLRSIFQYMRDRTKVRVVFENSSGDTIVFYGLINEEATRVDALNETITFRVLSRDSVIRNTRVAGGTVANNITARTAFLAVLNNAVITSVLTVSSGNINPSSNITIDLGSAFDGQPTQDVLNSLLIATNSVMLIDSSGNIIVKSRAASTTTSVLNLYGPFDLKRRQNIIDIKNYNSGLQRMFTSVALTSGLGSTTYFDSTAYSGIYGYRQNEVEFDFLTSSTTISAVGRALLAEFQVPKIELEVEVPTSIARAVDLLDRISIDWPLRITPYTGYKFTPIIGITKIGATSFPLPSKSGSLNIDPNIAFKVMEINEDPNTFTTTLKLRQVGTSLSDGYFSDPSSSIVGYAIIGVSPIGGTDDPANTYNPSVIGAAQVGLTKVG